MLLVVLGNVSLAQNYTSSADGAFSTGSNWSGGSAPPLSGQTWGSVTVQNNMSTSTNYTVGSFALSVSTGKTFTINGNLNFTNSGGTIDVYGTLIVTGNLTASGSAGSFFIHPGGVVDIYGNGTINNNSVITVGTSASAPPYADLIFENNVTFASGGAGMTVNKNGRVAVWGNLSSSGGGGQALQINNGGEMYVNGNIALTGGGDQINANNTSPYGLYVNGTTSNTGGGASTSSYIGDKSSMQTTNPGFYSWVQSQHNSPLPIMLIYFSATLNETSVDLKWATESELNFDHFEIEKSTDGKKFKKLVHVNGHGTTHQKHDYKMADDHPVIGKNYYRLKSVDTDGRVEVFQIVEADYNAEKKAFVYPNPLGGQNLHIDLNFEAPEQSRITITDVLGEVKFYTTTSESQNLLTNTLASGIYLLTVANGSFSHISRIVVE